MDLFTRIKNHEGTDLKQTKNLVAFQLEASGDWTDTYGASRSIPKGWWCVSAQPHAQEGSCENCWFLSDEDFRRVFSKNFHIAADGSLVAPPVDPVGGDAPVAEPTPETPQEGGPTPGFVLQADDPRAAQPDRVQDGPSTMDSVGPTDPGSDS